MRRGRAGHTFVTVRRLLTTAVLVSLAAAFVTTAAASAGTLFSKIPGEVPEGFYTPSAALLPGGEVLIAGGWERANHPVKTAEMFDPASATFKAIAAELAVARGELPAVSLPNGKVLLVGGYNESEKALSSAELFNPATGKFEATGEMTTARDGAGAALLRDGKVLVVGGANNTNVYQKTAELYDPATGKFTALAAEAKFGRYQPGVVALPNGKVLILGGSVKGEVHNEYVKTAELYDPTTGTFEALEGAGHEPTERRAEMAAVLMQDGLVLIAAGFNEVAKTLATEETFDYRTDTFEKLSNELTEPRDGPAGVTLADGRVLIFAGATNGPTPYLKTAELSAVAQPTASTTPASAVGQNAATLNGTALTEAVGNVYFQYGPSTGYGSSTAKQPLGASLTTQPTSAAIAGLAPDTTYHFRVIAENVGGTSYGADQTFTTASAPIKKLSAPRIASLTETNRTWREGSKLARISARKAPVGTTFKVALDQAASIRLVFTQQASGRKLGRRCVAQTHANRHHRACKRTLTRGAITLAGHAGLNKIRFQGKLTQRRKLPLGAYTVTTTATNSAGHSPPQRLTFTIVR
jgi:Galactose oxidase, central domain